MASMWPVQPVRGLYWPIRAMVKVSQL